MYRSLCFTSGNPTILDPSNIEVLGKHKGLIDGIHVEPLSEDHRLLLQGEFGGFRVYCLTTHTRPEVIPESVNQISETHFSAALRLELHPNVVTEHQVVFRAPILPFRSLRAVAYGLYPDCFEFKGYSGPGAENFICDLTFLTHYAENAPKIPLQVRYIGIAKAPSREAQDRLGEGHEKLQKLLAERNRRPSRQTISIVLYRPSELEPPILPFPTVIEAIEATMIQYFKPNPLNVKCLDFPSDSPDLTAKIKSAGALCISNIVHSPMGTQLFSDVVKASSVHTINVNLP
jgi:hypothetical protein